VKFLPPILVALATFGSSQANCAESADWPEPGEIEHFVTEMVAKHAFSEADLRAMFDAIHPNEAVLRAIAPPTDPRVKSWERYRARFLNRKRIEDGVIFWRRHEKTLKRAEAEYGVPAAIIVAIIGVETEYGRNTGRFETFQALSTLAFAYPPRAPFFRSELEEFLLLARDNELPVRGIKGSFAGAIGIPQFMPGSQRKFAVDFDGNGRIDLRGSAVDAIGSVARFLNLHGWTAGAPIAETVADAVGVRPEWVAAGMKPTLEQPAIEGAGIAAGSAPSHYPAALIDLVTPDQDTEYWWGFGNFYVITRYNRSSFYAMSVAQLADAIARHKTAAHGKGARTKAPVRAGYPAPRHPGG
jgi:membrane-bound lytic murein transglycosylase B